MKRIFLVSLLSSMALFHTGCAENTAQNTTTTMDSNQKEMPNIYTFQVVGLNGETIDFAHFKGKKILIVNTASECGYTPQYEGLEALYKAHSDKLVIVGFPANDFGAQEPGTNEEIAAFCKKNYGVSFPMAAKVSVKGESQAPIYQWLTQKSKNGFEDSEVKWNFHKYVLNERGELIAVFPSAIAPDSEELKKALGI